jgi:hypothetical protein
MEELTEFVAAILQRGATSASNHAACLKELNELLDDESEQFPSVIHDAMVVFIFSKQLKAEAALRLRELLARFIGAPDREQFEAKPREMLSKTIAKCMSTLKRASQVQENDIRVCCLTMLSTITKLGAKWWPYVLFRELCLQNE